MQIVWDPQIHGKIDEALVCHEVYNIHEKMKKRLSFKNEKPKRKNDQERRKMATRAFY